MLKLKYAALAALALAGSFGASSAFAAGYEIWNGSSWVRSGTVTLSGPTTATYLGNTVPCTSAFTLTLSYDAGTGVQTAQVTGASFTGSGACTGITKVLPWSVSAPSALSDPSVLLTISGINIHFPAPPQTCTGSVTAQVPNANPYSPNPPGGVGDPAPYNEYIGFNGTLTGGCSVSHRSPGLTADTPLRAYFP